MPLGLFYIIYLLYLKYFKNNIKGAYNKNPKKEKPSQTNKRENIIHDVP